MTQVPINAPKVNANDAEIRIVHWIANKGDRVITGQPICLVETTKTAVEITASCEGFIFPIAPADQAVPVGAIIGFISSSPDDSCVLINPAEPEKERVTISAKARKEMEKNGLSLEDFPGLSAIRLHDVAIVMAERAVTSGVTASAKDYDFSENDILIYGTGSHSICVHEALVLAKKFRPAGFVDFAPTAGRHNDLPVFFSGELPELFERGARHIHICLPDQAHERKVAREVISIGFSLENVIHPSASVSDSAFVGRNVFVGPMAIVGPLSQLDDFTRILNGASVAHHARLGSGTRISDGARIAGTVTLGRDCLIGLNATINLRITIGDRVTVVSGASVYDNIPSGATKLIDGRLRLP